jgi:hypothetical protein
VAAEVGEAGPDADVPAEPADDTSGEPPAKES